ncbi:hypothetical protein C8R46DRAFT_1236341 [Mycena filopes]|nr:hypothetical protein C8R46DRAFT_1236341 [Mycena filopes]
MLHYSPSSVVSPRYSHSRVLCLAGYRDFPAIYTAMIFDLHQVPLLTSRIVKCNDHVFELWSPNSAQRPFFPGNIRADYVPAPAERRDYRRYDGHSGKHDCMVVPQYFLGHRPHWPFLRRSSMVAATDPAYAAYEVLIPHWEVEDGEPRRGRLTLKFMARLRALNSELDLRMDDFRNALGVTSPAWIGRPRLPSSAHLYSLSELRSWEATVDAGVAVQRGIREKEAWIAFAQARLDLHEISDSALLYEEMPPAREDYIGMWVNGMEERAVLRYMKSGVPCFIVHEYKHSALSRDAMHPDTTPVYDSFLAGTEVATSLCDANPYQQLGALEGTRLHGIIGGDDGRGPFRTALARDEERSSSIYVESLPPRAPPLRPLPPSRKPPQSTPSTASAPPRFVFPDAAVAPRNRPQPNPSVKRALPKAAPSAPNLPRVVVPIYGPPATNRAPSPAAPSSAPSSFALAAATTASTVAAVDKYAPPPLETREVDPTRVPWYVSPRIATPEAKGTWTKWELADLNGLPAFIFRGKGWKGETRFERFDRDRKRRLCMHDYADLPGVVKPNHYGAPVPRVPFFIDDNGRGVPQYASHWMYESMTSPRRDEGKRAPQPHAEELPLKAEGKGKARAVLPMGEDSEDEDAIVTGGAGLSLDGVPMRVDEAEAAEASNVVVIEGVDSETSAQMFWRLSIDVLNRVRVAPLSILRAQGMMWVHVESTTAGRRALGALGVLSHGLTLSFRPEVEFMEAARYSVDIWVPDAAVPDAPPETDEEMPDAGRGRSRSRSTRPGSRTPSRSISRSRSRSKTRFRSRSTSSSSSSNSSSSSSSPSSRAPSPSSSPTPRRRTMLQTSANDRRTTPVLRVDSRSPPRAPRAMRAMPRRDLAARLSDARPVQRLPLLERLSASSSTPSPVSPPLPLANRLGPRPLAARLESIEEDVEEDSRAERLRSWADRLHAEIEGPRTDPPRSDTSLGKRRGDDEEGERPKKKVRRGRRSGRVVKEMEARKEERRRRAIEREAEEVAATSGTITLTMAPPAAPSQPQASTSAIASTSAVAATSAEREEGEVDDDFVLGASWQEEDDDDDAQAASLYHR